MSTLLRQALAKLKANNGSCSSFSVTTFEDEYEMTEQVIESGSNFVTYLGRSLVDQERVAVKVINKSSLTRTSIRRIVNEVKVLRHLSHPNIVMVYDIYNRDEDITIVSEYIEGKSLADCVVDESFDFTENDCRFVLETLVNALKYCKEKGVVHRNITPNNIIFSTANGETVLKIVDFQWSKQLDKEEMAFSLLETMCGQTPLFIAPEVLRGKTYNYKCDVWSVGVILYLLLSGGYLPFSPTQRDSMSNLVDRIKHGKWSFQPENAWKGKSDHALDLVRKMLVLKPAGRYTYEQILAHKFFTEKPKAAPEPEVPEIQLELPAAARTIRSTLTSIASNRCI